MRYWMVASVIGLLGAGVALAEQPATQTVQATGMARAPQKYQGVRARLMAERGAQVVAARNLAARERGLSVPGEGRSSYDTFSGSIRGHRYSPAIHHPDGTAEVTAEVDLPVQPARTRDYACSYGSAGGSGTKFRSYSSTVYPNGRTSVTTIRRTAITRSVTLVP